MDMMEKTSTIVGAEVDERLREAAVNGDVEYLRECAAANKPYEFYLTVFPLRYEDDLCYGNILHISAAKEQEEFIREAIELLPVEIIQQLLLQRNDVDQGNPLHDAVWVQNVRIVKMFLNAFIINNNNNNNPPLWLMEDQSGRTPWHDALDKKNYECVLEIFRFDKETLSKMLDVHYDHDDETSTTLLEHALFSGKDNLVFEILSSSHSFITNNSFRGNPLHLVPHCSSSSERRKDICRLLLKSLPQLIQQKSDVSGSSLFNAWAHEGKIWPFECLLESYDIIPNVRKIFVELISTTNNYGENPFHNLANKYSSARKEGAQIGKLLLDIYRGEANAMTLLNFPTSKQQYPWLVQDNKKKTPLEYAMNVGNEEFAQMILSEDKNVLKTCPRDVLFLAIEKRFHQVPLKILEIVDEQGLTHLLTNDQKLNALHLAPQCGRDFCERLIKQHPELIEGKDKEGETILHKWVKIGQVWPFEWLLNNSDIGMKWQIINLTDCNDNNNENNPFHVAASCTNESTLQIIKVLVQGLQQLVPYWTTMDTKDLPWYAKNKRDEGALHVAIRCQLDQQLALYLLSPSLYTEEINYSMAGLLDFYAPKEHLILFLAVEKNFFQVVKTILAKLNKASCSKYLQDSSTGTNILHLAATCTDAEFVQWLIGEVPSEFITTPDKDGISPLGKACEVGATRLVKLMLEKDLDPSAAFRKEPLAWVKACENGHVSVIQEFVDCCPEKFSDHCFKHHDTPLHHIKLRNLTRYEDFLKIQYMKDLINAQDSNGATPLHKAIENQNILLAEVLLNTDKIRYNIKNVNQKTAKDLLAQVCKEDKPWNQMCENIGFDPNLRTSYFERKTDLLEVRNTLSVVAALLATITFTAGFTLPGGLNQETGEAMMVNKAIFAVFLLSDTLSMCFSMVVLISLIWSMTLERNQSLFLIDQSVGLLKLSLYLTLIAFVSGVYIVTSTKLLWATILVIVLCSLVAVSASRQLLYKVLTLKDNLFSFRNHRCIDPINRMEQGLSQHSLRGESSNQNTALHLHTS